MNLTDSIGFSSRIFIGHNNIDIVNSFGHVLKIRYCVRPNRRDKQMSEKKYYFFCKCPVPCRPYIDLPLDVLTLFGRDP